MNDELQNALAEILVSAAQAAAEAKEFVLSELPDVVQQLLMWKMAESIVLNIWALLIFGTWLYATWRFQRYTRQVYSESHYEDEWYVFWTVAVLGGLVGVGVPAALMNIAWLKILIAPKVYLIEYAASLVR